MRKFLITINILLFSVFVYFILLLIYPYRIIEFEDAKFPVLTKEIEVGGNLIYKARACKYMDLPAIKSLSFVDTLIYNTPDVATKRGFGCRDDNIVIKLPKILPPGTYYLTLQYAYRPNFLRTIIITHETEEFIIK